MPSQSDHIVPDSEHKGIIGLLPGAAQPFALLARFDRPIGWWLLFWPCAWGVALAGGAIQRWDLLLWLLLGSIAMRGAGCVYNDIVDRDLDRQVERTRSRPLASGATSLNAAWIWLGILCLIGLAVWIQLNTAAKLVALGSLALVAAYPFMKRITWWPQAWLGLVFSWGALVGWLAILPQVRWAMVLLYCGSIFWVIGYDTIYALQDREDDALVGIRSSALRLGENVRFGVLVFYLVALTSWAAAFWMLRPQWLGLVALVPVGLHLLWQVTTLNSGDGDDALAKFRSNRFAGFLLFLACLVLGQAG
ncbi:4-hydroxybenzoate octaprenyltransferase [Sphingorhabdus sp. 109]|jgi:4-hydroxybenzoate polyprenyltransferase|uniref:4-hydroxybenzoate octaprenyltransferase n=1 Tax=Sphingorhabdus sp. 109 TaxID=2653173 RepID=UPI0012F02B7E|nr:4-hydroxybenzoate octaprenyltransferase [Sphingorhabdus sp. 109]VWX59100.1 4-hydroxybenzoate octaprenyltransferase [Sphingorhabdus sp. 109]